MATPSVTTEPLATAHGAEASDAVEAVLAYLLDRHGLDLRGYRRATLVRRLAARMISARAASVQAYLELLHGDPGEPARLLGRLTIKVSRLFRNPEAVDVVRHALEARIARAPDVPLTVWSAGCARGEEPYTIAMLLADVGQREGPGPSILATDVDPGALADARRACYGPAALVDVPAAVRLRHLLADCAPAGTLRVAPHVRRRVRFEPHDLALAATPPGEGRFDLVCCRNTLIYFEPPLQRRAERLLLDALAPGGLLWVGEAEWPSAAAAARLETVNRRARLFRLAPARDANAA